MPSWLLVPHRRKARLHSNTCTHACTHTHAHTTMHAHTGTPPPGSSVSPRIITSSLNELPADPKPSYTSLSGEAVTLENHSTVSSIDLTLHCLHSYKYLPISSPHTEYCGCNSLTPHSRVCSQVLGSHPLTQGVGWETELRPHLTLAPLTAPGLLSDHLLYGNSHPRCLACSMRPDLGCTG